MITDKKIGSIIFLGGGKMAEAIFSRLISKAGIDPQNIIVADIDSERLAYLKKKHGIRIASSNEEAVGEPGPIVLAVKPQNMDELMTQISPKAGKRLVISIAAGVKTKKIEEQLTQARVVRVMPNTAAMVGQAITAISRGSRVSDEDVETTREIFSSVGKVMEIDEKLQNSVTAVSGSGPAYFFYLAELLAEAGKSTGLDEEQSLKLATQTAIGAGELLKTGREAKELREMVTSKGGTTEAALKAFQENKLSDIVRIAVQQALTRAKELSEG